MGLIAATTFLLVFALTAIHIVYKWTVFDEVVLVPTAHNCGPEHVLLSMITERLSDQLQVIVSCKQYWRNSQQCSES